MSWGGAREGAGRPAKGPVPSEPHTTRPQLAARHPVHVVARLAKLKRSPAPRLARRGSSPAPHLARRATSQAPRPAQLVGSSALTHRVLRRALERAIAVSLARSDFRIVHLAVLRTRIELLVEADDKTALARGMQGFQVSAAKSLNRAVHRRGPVFPDRYRMRILKTRVEVRDLIGRLPGAARATPSAPSRLTRTETWPQTWLLRIELERHQVGTARPRRSIRSRADEHSR